MSEQQQLPKENKVAMSDEERLALCHKLDQELDVFINSLEQKRYTDGWQEDSWEEEMEKHPFFMKQTPDNKELSPLAEGLAKLKYDPLENTSLELATNYKEDGNFNFKHKNYRMAIMGYTEGIKINCGDSDLEASLYNNRAAAHWHLKNYRSSLCDSEKALSFNPLHIKARLRAAKAALETSKFDTCIEHCQKILESEPDNEEIKKLLTTAKKRKLIKERDDRKRDRVRVKDDEQRDEVVNAIIERGIRVSKGKEKNIDLKHLEPNIPGAEGAIVHLVKNILIWPILFLYPEHEMTDFIKECPEDVPLIIQLEQLFPAPWDEENKYNCSTINVYFEGWDNKPHLVSPTENLCNILLHKYFVLKVGTPAFFILPRNSSVESRFLERFNY